MRASFFPNIMNRGYPTPLHNKLVTESAVPVFLVLSQTDSECIQQLIPHNSRRTHIRQPGRKDGQHAMCNNCGTSHHDWVLCPAAHRMCYNCRSYGHYARFCNNKNPRTCQPDTSRDPVDRNNQTDSSPEVVCTAAVYSHSDGAVEQQLVQAQKEKDQLQATCDTLKAQNNQLCEQIDSLKTTNEDLHRKTSHLEGLVHTLFKFSTDLHFCIAEYDHLTDHLIKEFHEAAGVCENPACDTGLRCVACYTPYHTDPDSCPAKDSHCIRCNQTGHFAATCDSEHLPVVSVSREIETLLNTLGQMFSISKTEPITCDNCDDTSFYSFRTIDSSNEDEDSDESDDSESEFFAFVITE